MNYKKKKKKKNHKTVSVYKDIIVFQSDKLQLALWNTSGLTQHTEELKTFISIHNIEFMLISETHFTEKAI
jgi:hypothetical protein